MSVATPKHPGADAAPSSARRDVCTGLLWVSPWLIGGTLFLLVPMAMSLYYSLTDYPILKPPVFIGLDNYTSMLSDVRLKRTVANTLVFGAAFVPLSTAVSLVLAALLSTRGRGGQKEAHARQTEEEEGQLSHARRYPTPKKASRPRAAAASTTLRPRPGLPSSRRG